MLPFTGRFCVGGRAPAHLPMLLFVKTYSVKDKLTHLHFLQSMQQGEDSGKAAEPCGPVCRGRWLPDRHKLEQHRRLRSNTLHERVFTMANLSYARAHSPNDDYEKHTTFSRHAGHYLHRRCWTEARATARMQPAALLTQRP